MKLGTALEAIKNKTQVETRNDKHEKGNASDKRKL